MSESANGRLLESPVGHIGTTRETSLSQATKDRRTSETRLNSSPSVVRSDNRFMDSAIPLEGYDPFGNMYRPWLNTPLANESGEESASPPTSSPEVDSPVLRTSTLQDVGNASFGENKPNLGLGIGLLEPFRFPEDDDFNAQLGLEYLPLEGEETEVELAIRRGAPSFGIPRAEEYNTESPSRKRRRTKA
jgi:hypothetical protein